MSADHSEQTHETDEAIAEASQQEAPVPLSAPDTVQTDAPRHPTEIIDTSIDGESSLIVGTKGETEQTQTDQEMPSSPVLDPLPDMEETIVLSPRARRILLYMARRKAHQSAVTTPHAQEILPEITALPTRPLTPIQPIPQDTSPTLPAMSIPISTLKPITPNVSPLPLMEQLHSQSVQLHLLNSFQTRFTRRRSTSQIDPKRRKRLAHLQHFSRKKLRRARANDHRASRSLWTRIWITTSTLLMIFLTIGAVGAYVAYQFINTTQGTYASQVLTLRDLLPPDNLKIYDSQNTLIDQLTDQGVHTTVKYAQVAP
ncbi:MAG: hypothetical protein ACRDHZ_02765, partial [Ktedonobacteraceae bacterium]